MSEIVRSPITGAAARMIDALDPAILISRYSAEWGLDVADAFEGLEKVELFLCPDTGYRFFHPQRLAAEASIYDQIGSPEFVAEHGGEIEWKPDWQFGFEQITEGDRILDVGCSDGGFLVRASSISAASGLEGNAISSARARDRGLDVTSGYVIDYLKHHAGEFDKVFAFQVLEHVYAVRDFVEGLIGLLKPKGKLILVVPNCDPWFAGWGKYDPLNNPPHHIGLWNESALRGMAKSLGLVVAQVAFLGEGATIKQDAYRRACLLAKVYSPARHHSGLEWSRIALAAPIAIAGLITGRRRHAGDVAVVLRK